MRQGKPQAASNPAFGTFLIFQKIFDTMDSQKHKDAKKAQKGKHNMNKNAMRNEIERIYDKLATEKKVNAADIEMMRKILIENGVDIDTLCGEWEHEYDDATIVDTFIRWNIKEYVNADDWYINCLCGDYFPAYDWFLLLKDWAMDKIDIEE